MKTLINNTERDVDVPSKLVSVHPPQVASHVELEEGTVDYMEEPSSNISLLPLVHLIWQRRAFLLRMAVWSLAVCALIAFSIPRRYQSMTKLMPPDDRPTSGLAMLIGMNGGGSGNQSLGSLATGLLGIKSSGSLFLGILQSRTVQDDLIDKFDLRKVYWVKRWKAAREKLAARTEISEDRKSGIITVAVTDRSPERAAAMVKEYVAELNSVLIELNTSAAHRERVFLEERLGEVQRDLEIAEKDFSQFASKNTAIDIKEQGKAMVGAAAELQGELIAAQSELEGLKQIYTEDNIRVRATRARIGELQHELEKLGGKGDISSAEGHGGSLYPSIRELPLLGATYADLYRRVAVQEAVYETLTKQCELAKVEEAKEIPSVKVLDPADVPETKSFPPRLVIVIFGAATFLAIGILWVLAEEHWKGIDPRDPRKLFALEVYEVTKARLPKAMARNLPMPAEVQTFSSASKTARGNPRE